MTESILSKINALIIEVRKFIEADEPWEVPLNHTLSEREVIDKYAEFINYDNKLTNHIKNVDLFIHILTQAKFGLSDNTNTGQRAIKQLNAQIEILKSLRKPLDDINSAHYLVAKYFEKGGGLF